MRGFGEGLQFWWRGWGHILSHRHLLALSVFPAVLAFAFAGGLVWLLWTHLGLWVSGLMAMAVGLKTGFFYSLVYYPLLVSGGALLTVAALYVAFLIHACIAVPFYSVLAEQTMIGVGKKTTNSWRDALRMVRVSLAKAVLLLAVGVVLFVFSFMPLLNILAMACALLIMAFDCMDYSFDCKGYSVGQRLLYLGRERGQWLGMAAGLALTLFIPGLTLIIAPGAVVGAALIVKDE